MKVYLSLIAAFLVFSTSGISQDTEAAKSSEAAYNQTINTRVEKIVATLAIADSAKATLVKNCIANQYKNLNSVYSARDLQIKIARETQGNETQEIINTKVDKIKEATLAKTNELHKVFISQLSINLNPQQIDQVKDGMTYGVLGVTYNGYNQMILTLTDEQKGQIMSWLVEARELAMDAESAEKKHACFGKYKGRINNYLSAAGYDLKKEGEEWEKRRKDETAQKKKL